MLQEQQDDEFLSTSQIAFPVSASNISNKW